MKSLKGASAAGESTYRDALVSILSRADLEPPPVFSSDDIRGWPAGLQGILEGSSILQEASSALSAVCDGCEQACIEDVQYLDRKGKEPRAYIICGQRDDIGRVAVPPGKLRRWQFNLSHLAALISSLLGNSSAPENLLQDRLWNLGTIRLGKKSAEAFLFRTVGEGGPGSTLRDATSSDITDMSIVFTLSSTTSIPASPRVKSAPLSKILKVHNGQFIIDREIINSLSEGLRGGQTQKTVPINTPPGTNWEQVQITFMNPENVQIKVGDIVQNRSYVEMGFADLRKRAASPDEHWAHIRSLAQTSGLISWGVAQVTQKDRHKVKKWISEIRKRLKTLFPDIDEDPFYPYREIKSYQTRFTIGGKTTWD